jgi:hypothetical protein
MSKKIPRGDDHLICPMWQKSMAEVCHTCPWWVEVKGKHPQTGEDASDWNCAIAWGPVLAINTAQQARQTAAAVESFRNETVRTNENAMRVIAATSPQRNGAYLIESKS